MKVIFQIVKIIVVIFLVLTILALFGIKLLSGPLHFISQKIGYGDYQQKGLSMEPTIHDGQRIHSWAYKDNSPNRRDVVVLKSPELNKPITKRIVGLPGETIQLKKGMVYINGTQLAEPYLMKQSDTFPEKYLVEGDVKTIPQESYFVMGDNREKSSDSRMWGFVPLSDIIGKVNLSQ